MKKVTAVLPARNNRRQLLKCIKILNSGSYVPELIIIDDGSDDGTAQMVRKLWPSATLLVIPAHTGYAHAANAGLRLVRTDYALLIRPDLQPGRRCVEKLLQVLQEGEEDRIFCAVPLFMKGKKPENGAEGSGSHRPREERSCAVSSFAKDGNKKETAAGRGRAETTAEKNPDIIAVRDGCAMYNMRALEEIGWMDERHFQGLEGFDLSMRAALYGYRTVQAGSAAVRPFETGGADTSSTFRRQLAAGNGKYVFYKNLPALQRFLGTPLSLITDAAKIGSFVRHGEFEQYRMAVSRGRALCSLERERREALEEGVSVYPETLADASFLGIDDPGGRIYPLFLAEKKPFGADRLLQYLKIQFLLTRGLRGVIRLMQ